jgi:hypothetical protein
MEFLRALKIAAIIGIAVAAVWLFREDHLCKAAIGARVGPTEVIEHTLGSQRYDVVPKARAGFWHRGDPYPVVVTCWTDFSGISNFEQH